MNCVVGKDVRWGPCGPLKKSDFHFFFFFICLIGTLHYEFYHLLKLDKVIKKGKC